MLAFIRNDAGAEGSLASVHEICEDFGYPSVEVAAAHVAVLQPKGFLRGSWRPRFQAGEPQLRPACPRASTVDIPILDAVPAEFSGEMAECPEDCLTMDVAALGIGEETPTFAVRAPDDSLLSRHVCQGDTVVCERGLAPVEGDIVVALVNGESVLRVWTQSSGEPQLILPEDPAEAVPAGEQVVQGVMVAVVRQMGG